jgi:hypothetical protein
MTGSSVKLAVATVLLLSGVGSTQVWQPLQNQPSFHPDTALLLTDGTVMVHQYMSRNWWRLTPDQTGNYRKGTWTQLASMQSNYGPLFFASAVLPDGRVIVEGGEYNLGQSAETNLGAIYDPPLNQWTPVDPPEGWKDIGDSPSVVLSNGRFLLGQRSTTSAALLDAGTLTWTAAGTGKHDRFNEAGLTLLPDGTVLTVEADDPPEAEKYYRGKWISAGNTQVILPDPGFRELGPVILRPDGTAFATGANANDAGHTSLYHPPAKPAAKGKWIAGPDIPDGNDMGDAPAALLPNGNVLCDTSPGIFRKGVTFYEFDGIQFVKVPGAPGSNLSTSENGRMLVLPTGQVLFITSDGVSRDIEIYTATGKPAASWAPTITTAPVKVVRSGTYKIFGTQFNGLSAGADYGDDAQMATNYPLVRITNRATKHVFYARTHDHSTMAVATKGKSVSTKFDIPPNMETGRSTLQVVANGIASLPVSITVK